MRILSSLIVSMCLGLSYTAAAQQQPEIPSVCSDSVGTVALLDCLQNQQDILRRVLEYQQLVVKIFEVSSVQGNQPPQIPAEENLGDSNPGMDRVNWFDQNLEIYAIAGMPDDLIAYARLDGREYRLQAGDTIRLALVTNVYPKGVFLLVSGHEFSVGLSGRLKTNQSENASSQ